MNFDGDRTELILYHTIYIITDSLRVINIRHLSLFPSESVLPFEPYIVCSSVSVIKFGISCG